MAENSAAGGVVKFGLGLGVGFGLYLLISNLAFGGGLGFGGERSDAGRGEASPTPPPPMPRDEQRLEFVMVAPTTLDNKTPAFQGPGDKLYSLDEMIARIKAGGRTDVLLKVRGNVISGPADDAEAQIKQAGIDLWKPAPPPLFPERQPAADVDPEPVKVSGNTRGQYGRGHYRGYGR